MVYGIIDKQWKVLLWIPIIFLVLSSTILVFNMMGKGFFIGKDIELTGGKMITLDVDNEFSTADLPKVKDVLPYANVRLTSGVTKNLIIEIPFEMDENEIISKLENIIEIKSQPTLKTVGPILGEIFFQQATMALIIAFVFMAMMIFIIFRSFVPSSIVILAAITDIVGTVAIIDLMGIKLSLPVIVALLTIIGYSVDTDIILTTEVLKERENVKKSIDRAMRTGLTLTTTTIVALSAIYFISGSFVLEQIALVLIIGLIIDLPSTWFTNAGLLRKWVKKND